MERSFLIGARQRPVHGPRCAAESPWLQLRRRLQLSGRFWAANQLHLKPYRYGGGHSSFHDSGYDCSGTVSYALGGAGLISSPMSSSDFRRYGQRGQGRRITVYTRNGHTFAVIAGLRLDTTPGDSSRYRWAPSWQTTFRGPAGFEARHPVGL